MSVSRETERQTKKRLYSIWHNMKSRCYNPNATKYEYYGGAGVTVCDEWKNDFKAFYAWALQNGYAAGLTIDRKYSGGDYNPSNCHWADRYQQNRNTSKNTYITHNGETKTAAEWAYQYGVDRCVFVNRIRRGWPFERAVQPARHYERQQKERNQ